MNRKVFQIVAFLLSILSLTCQEPGNDGGGNTETGKLNLAQTEKSLSSVTLKLTKENINASISLKLYKNNDSVFSFSLYGNDTLLMLGGLAPSTNYNWYVKGKVNGKELLSNILEARTEDTTSQEFEFKQYRFGKGLNSSMIKDAWIFDENNIWAVGYISQDSFPGNCNIVRWNGKKWRYIASPGVATTSGIYGMWAIDSNHVYFANRGAASYINGQFTNYVIPGNWTEGQEVTAIWGSSETNIWGVGDKGTVVHYNGTSWKKIKIQDKYSELNLYAVSGNKGSKKAYALGILYDTQESIVVSLGTDSLTELKRFPFSSHDRLKSGIEFLGEDYLLSANDFYTVYYDPEKNKIEKKLPFVNEFYPVSVSGNGLNDWFVFGRQFAGTGVYHYNGVQLKRIYMDVSHDAFIYNIRTKDNITVACGWDDGVGTLLTIKRTKK